MEVIGIRDCPVRPLPHPSAPGRGYLTTPPPREAPYAVGNGRVRAKKTRPKARPGAPWRRRAAFCLPGNSPECPLVAISRHAERWARESALPLKADING